MKKSTKLIVALLVVVAALAVTYRLMHRVPSADLEANAQMQQIITDAGCLRCHTSTPDLPFYASMPVAGKIVMEDVSKAYRAFDMTQMEADLEAGQPLNPADLAKIEKVILDGKMPQAKYYLVHWGLPSMTQKGSRTELGKKSPYGNVYGHYSSTGICQRTHSSHCRFYRSGCTQSRSG